MAEDQKKLIEEQIKRKDRLAKELKLEIGRLQAMKKEVKSLMRPLDSRVPPEEIKRNLISEIYQLQLECDRLADEVDKRSDPRGSYSFSFFFGDSLPW